MLNPRWKNRKRRHTPKKRTTFRDGSGIFLVEFAIYPFFFVTLEEWHGGNELSRVKRKNRALSPMPPQLVMHLGSSGNLVTLYHISGWHFGHGFEETLARTFGGSFRDQVVGLQCRQFFRDSETHKLVDGNAVLLGGVLQRAMQRIWNS